MGGMQSFNCVFSIDFIFRDGKLMEGLHTADVRGKLTMKELFGKRNITKNGQPGKVIQRLSTHSRLPSLGSCQQSRLEMLLCNSQAGQGTLQAV